MNIFWIHGNLTRGTFNPLDGAQIGRVFTSVKRTPITTRTTPWRQPAFNMALRLDPVFPIQWPSSSFIVDLLSPRLRVHALAIQVYPVAPQPGHAISRHSIALYGTEGWKRALLPTVYNQPTGSCALYK